MEALIAWIPTALEGSVPGGVAPWLLMCLVLAGVVAGVLNAIAGGGSFLTLPMLMIVGLAPSVANGTMRVAVLLQGMVVIATFWRRGVRDRGTAPRILLPVLAGAAVGAFAASHLEDAVLRPVFGVALVAWAALLGLRPGSFERSGEE
ncbi:MAG: sulfite exporter TauE/SafE family protein, partial [Nannocystaceae bacterium]